MLSRSTLSQSRFTRPLGQDDAAIGQVQANVRNHILRAFVARGHIEAGDAKDMAEPAASSRHGGGFSVDAGVRIAAPYGAGLERLLTNTQVSWCSRHWS